MINFIFGRAGSGKTSRICDAAAASLATGRRVFLVVPEQMAVDAEQRMADRIGDAPSLSLEILNFRRLTNRIFREYGGLSYSYITKSGRSLMMWQTLTELAPMLSSDAAVDRARVAKMLGAVSEFKAYNITPRALERAAESLGEGAFSSKLSDLSLIFASYTNLVAEVCDDAADDLTKAAELLREHDFFAGAHVCFDAFHGFTPQEFAILREILRQAADVTISLPLDPNDSTRDPFENQRTTANLLLRLAKTAGGEVTMTRLTENHRAASPELRFLEENLWSLDLAKEDAWHGDAPALRLAECPSLFAECEAAAVDICRRVRAGARWRDFAVITRGLDRFEGILDVIFEKYGIPCFLSRRTDIKSKPLIRFILTALTLGAANFRTADVITLVKTGLAGITPDEAFLLENYAETWSIRGASRWSEDFDMNPDGYTAVFTEEAARRLVEINRIRETVMTPLIDFHAALNAAKTVRDHAAALYDFLVQLAIPDKLAAEAEALRLTDPAAASESEQLWGILIDALDELCGVMPDMDCDGMIFTELLTVLFDNTDIGRIPGTIDEVMAGDASLLRTARKHVYIIGANEGVFPAAPSSDGILSDGERAQLASLGLTLAGGSEYQSADERFAFYRALTSASDSLTVLWSGSDLAGKALKPSLGVLRLQALFPDVKPEKYADAPFEMRLEGRANLLEFIAEAGDSEIGRALRAYAEATAPERLARLAIPLCDDEVHLSADTCALVAGGDLALTQARLDSYVLCHFSYFCKYILGLSEPKKAKFDAADIGNFVHHILELFVTRAADAGPLTSGEIDGMIDSIVSDYMKTVARIVPDYKGSRLAHLFARLRRSSALLCKNLAEEFAQSGFVPAFRELPIRFPTPGEATVEPLRVPLDDGTAAYIYGIADRVDTLEKDGKTYVRVIDYKTGAKEFSLDDVEMGLNLQMLLYLFSIWKNGARPDSALMQGRTDPGGEILPAGVLYFGASVPTVTLDAELPPDEVERQVASKLSRRGLLLDDRDVLSAMERELSGKYLPVKIKKDGSFQNAGALCTLEGFGKLLGSIETTIRDIGREIRSGNASAHPMKHKKHDACAHCPLGPVCRKGRS